MMQLWLLSLVYLAYTGIIYITPSIGIYNPTLLRIRDYLFNNNRYIIFLMISGYALSLLTLFFPTKPGPIIIGDLLVSVFIFLSASNYSVILANKEQSIVIDEKIISRHKIYAIIIFIVTFLHFLMPNWVIL